MGQGRSKLPAWQGHIGLRTMDGLIPKECSRISVRVVAHTERPRYLSFAVRVEPKNKGNEQKNGEEFAGARRVSILASPSAKHGMKLGDCQAQFPSFVH